MEEAERARLRIISVATVISLRDFSPFHFFFYTLVFYVEFTPGL